MQAFELHDLLKAREKLGRRYHEFLRVPEMSLGLYALPVGDVDPQQPHTEAEAYYVIDGRALMTVDDETQPIRQGVTIFVPANVPHRFHNITEDLLLLVFFAPAEDSQKA